MRVLVTLSIVGVGFALAGFIEPRHALDPRLIRHYENSTCRLGADFDERGVVLVDYGSEIGVQYNPTTISQYALSCYHSFRQTGDPRYEKIFLDQIAWLAQNYVDAGPDMAAYEYAFPWAYGLEPGWRSGLAQGQAISALIRYYYHTGDTSIRPLIRNLKNYMMLPIDKNGLVSTTADGGIWIEEYPSDPPSYVLNGNLSAIFGLYEYTRLFSRDSQASAEFSAVVDSMRKSAYRFDSGSWTYRYLKEEPYHLSNDGYGFAHYRQMLALWEITGEPVFLYAGLRWGTFFHDVHFDEVGNMMHDKAGRMVLHAKPMAASHQHVMTGNYEILSATPSMQGYGVANLFDGTTYTYFAAGEHGPAELHFRLNEPAVVNSVSIRLYNVDLYPKEVVVSVKSPGDATFRVVPYSMATDRRTITYFFEPTMVGEFKFVANSFAGQNRLVIGELYLANSRPAVRLPDLATQQVEVLPMPVCRFSLTLDAPSESEGEIFVIYRSADDPSDIAAAPWAWRPIDPFSNVSIGAEAAFYQFRVLATQEAGLRGWGGLAVADRSDEGCEYASS